MFSKGQEEAPFQLLVAVILMTFVIIIGLRAMDEAQKNRCFNETEKAMNDFKLALEKTATYKQPSNVIFNPPSCSKDEKFIIKKIDEPRICSSACLNSSTACIILRYSTTEIANVPDKCLNVSYSTQFRTVNDTTGSNTEQCISLEDKGYRGTDIESGDGLEKGSYQFLYASSPSISYPVVCTYIRE